MVWSATESARAARAARRRLTLADFVRLLGPALLWGSAAAVVLVASDRLGLAFAPMRVAVLAPLLVGLAIAAVLALVRRPTLGASAARLDRSLGLRDRVSTALALPNTDDPFSQWAREEGERVAREADASKAAPVRTDWTWGTWPIVLAACIAGAVFAPRVNWDRNRKPEQRITAAERVAAADRLAAAAEAARTESAAVEDASQDDLTAIRELEADLRAGEGDPAQAVTRAVGRMESMARDLEQRAGAAERTAGAVRDRLAAAGAPRKEELRSESSSALSEAMSRGDVPAAEAAAAELAKAADQMSEPDRLALAQDLERLASGLKPEPAAAESDAARQALEESGVPPEVAEEAARQPDPRRMQEELQQHGVEPEAAQRAAEKASEAREQQQSEQDARQQVDELREAMKDAAESVRKGEKTPPESGSEQPAEEPAPNGAQGAGRQPSTGSEQPKSEEPRGGERRPGGQHQPAEESGREQPGAGQKPEPKQGSQSPQGQPKEGQSSEPRQGGEQSVKPGSEPKKGSEQGAGEQKGTEPKASESGQAGKEPQPAPGQRDGAQPQPGTSSQTPAKGGQKDGARKPEGGQGSQPGKQPSQETPAGEQGAEGAAKQESKPGEQGTGQEKPDRPGGSPQGDTPGGMRGLQRRLREMAHQRDAARDLQERAQRLRDASRDLTRQPGSGAGESDEWGRGVGNSGRPSSAPPVAPRPVVATDAAVDARAAPGEGAQPREHVIAEWYSPDRADPAARGAAMATDLRSAARGAERAVEQQSVPARHSDLVRRVFRRYAERAAPP